MERSFVLEREWSNGAGDWEFVLKEFQKNEDEIEFTVAHRWRGDKDWAERVAKHYNIPMPEEKE